MSRNFVILAPWKSASSTVKARLASYNEFAFDQFYHYNDSVKTVTHQHITLAQFQNLRDIKDGLFKATFVRNPYDRAWSAFQQTKRDTKLQPNSQFPDRWIRELVMEQLAENEMKISNSGGDFDLWMQQITYADVHCVGKNSSFPFHPCNYWTHINDQTAIDFIGRVENFEPDFQRLLKKIHIEPKNADISANVTEEFREIAPNELGYKYTKFMQDRTIEKINELFESDFKLLGYQRLPVKGSSRRQPTRQAAV
jgi:Sulfotransferase family